MPVELGDLVIGSFFKLSTATAGKPDTYVLTKHEGTDADHLVVVNQTKSQILELAATTMVIELSLTTTVAPSFTLA
jgi:hypothetical protein